MRRWAGTFVAGIVLTACPDPPKKETPKPAPDPVCVAYEDALCKLSSKPCALLREVVDSVHPTAEQCTKAQEYLKLISKAPQGERAQLESVGDLLTECKHLTQAELTVANTKLDALRKAWIPETELEVDPLRDRALSDRRTKQLQVLDGLDVSDRPCEAFRRALCEGNEATCPIIEELIIRSKASKDSCRAKGKQLRASLAPAPIGASDMLESMTFVDLLESGGGLTKEEIADIRARIQSSMKAKQP